jgi:hypothetical protein
MSLNNQNRKKQLPNIVKKTLSSIKQWLKGIKIQGVETPRLKLIKRCSLRFSSF